MRLSPRDHEAPHVRATLAFAIAIAAVVPTALASPDAGTTPEVVPAEVRLGDDTVFVVRVERAGATTAARARRATDLVVLAVEQPGAHPVRVAKHTAVRIVYVGSTPVLELTTDDARANGDATVDVTAARVASRLRNAIAHEHRRKRLSEFVFSASLVVFAGLLAWLVIRRLTVITRALRIRIATREKEGRGLRFVGVELGTPYAAARSLDAIVVVASLLGRLAAFFTWATFALSLFPATLALRTRLVRGLVGPFARSLSVLGGIAESVVVACLWVAIVAFVLRLVATVFASIARGAARVAWLDATHAAAASALVRLGIVFVSIALAAPYFAKRIAVFPRVVDAFVFAVALGAAPSFASAVVGARLVFGGVIRLGDEVRALDRRGRVHSIGLFDFVLRDEQGAEVRIGYAPLLFRPIEIVTRMHEERSRLS